MSILPFCTVPIFSASCASDPTSTTGYNGETDSIASISTDSSSSNTSESTESKGYAYTGLCGTAGEADVTATAYNGFENRYLIGDAGDGPDICRVRFTVQSIGAPPVPCDSCDWAFTVEKTAYEVITDIDGGCAASEIDLGDTQLDAQIGEQTALGFATEDGGHAHVLLRFNAERGIWEAVSVASWSPDTGRFFFDRKDGFCGY